MRETEDNNKIESLDTNFDYTKCNYTDTELDNMDYEQAIIYDHRTFLQYYWSVLKQNQLIIFTFFQVDDFNLIYAKIALFIISFGLFITINGFFFSDDTMHKVYEDNGKFDIFYQIPQIFYSSVTFIRLIETILFEFNLLAFMGGPFGIMFILPII